MLDRAITAGSEFIIDNVEGVLIENDDGRGGGKKRISGLLLERLGILKSNKVVFAMGPWTGALLEQWIKGLNFPMEGIKSTSFIYRNMEPIKRKEDSFVCFCDEDENNCHLELYPRPDGDLYVCGCGGSEHISGSRLCKGGDSEHAGLILADDLRVEAAQRSFKFISSMAESKLSPDITQVLFQLTYRDALLKID